MPASLFINSIVEISATFRIVLSLLLALPSMTWSGKVK